VFYANLYWYINRFGLGKTLGLPQKQGWKPGFTKNFYVWFERARFQDK